MSQIHNEINSKLSPSIVYLITDYRLLITSLALALTGCMGIYEGGFECPPGKGLGCTSISEVNEWVNQNQVVNHQASEENSCHNCTSHSDRKPMNSDNSIWYSPWSTSIQNPYSQKSNTKLFDVQDSI